MEGRLLLRGEISSTKAVQILSQSDSIDDGHVSDSAHILDLFRKLRSFRKWHKGMDINPDDNTSYTTHYQEAFVMHVENEYCAKHRRMPANKHESLLKSNLIPSEMVLGSCQSSFDPYDLSSNDEGYLTPNDVAETTPRRSDGAARLLTAAMPYLNSPPDAPKNWGQINSNLNDYHSDPMEISSTFWLLDITDWWRQQEEPHSKSADLSNVARDIFSIIPHGVGVEASVSPGRDVISRRRSNPTSETLRETVVVSQFAQANHGILAGAGPELDTVITGNSSEMKKRPVDRKLHRMAKVHDLLEMWQGSQNLHATQNESHIQNKPMTDVGYTLDTEEIVNASWSLFQHDGAAAFKLSDRSPLPPPLSGKDLHGGRTQILNVRRIRRINCHLVESDDESAPESVSDTEDWLHWNADLDITNDSEDDCGADVESDREQDNSMEDPDCPEQRDVSAAPNLPGLILPTWKSKRQAEKVSMTVNAIKTRRNKGVKKMYDRIRQCFPSFFMYLDREFQLVISWVNGEQ